MFKEKLLLEALRRYAGHHVAERVLRLGNAAFDLGGPTQEMTVMCVEPCVDPEFREMMKSSGGARARIACWSKILEAIEKNDGVVDGYVGDSVFAYFGAGNSVNHASLAIACAVDIVGAAPIPDQPTGTFYPRIGIDTGQVFLGNIGTPERIKYTIMGDVINLASRLSCRVNDYGLQVLISEAAVNSAGTGKAALTTRLNAVINNGEPLTLFTLANALAARRQEE